MKQSIGLRQGSQAHVVGIPDEVAQEVPIAVIQKTGDDHPTYEALQELVSLELGMACSPKILLDLVEDLKLQQFPTTTSGKVRKVELWELAPAFLQRREAVVKEQPRTSTLDVLLGIWSQITGRPDESLPTDQPVNTFADSIMILRFSAQVKKELGRNLVLEELNDQNTIEEQAQLVSTHSKDSCVRVMPRTHRDGPSETGDMVHTLGDIARTERTREIAEPLLTQMHLSWDQHVEDVIPRSWPFWEDWAHGEQAPIVHPLDIAGPTLERVLNRMHIDRQERVSSFLRHVQEEQKQLTKCAHAPLYTIIARLEERERIPTDLDRGDGSILDTYFRRQCFNWLPNTKSGGDLARLEQMQPGSSADLGLQWNCGSVSEETLFVHAMWDDAQLRLREVQGAMDVFIKAVQWLNPPENWDKRVGEFEGLMK